MGGIRRYVVSGAGARRLGLLLTGLVIAGLAGAGATTSSAAPGPGGGERPNILFIVTDDQRIETLDVMPNAKRLFDLEGVHFPNAFATTPICCPARASIFTGRYAHNHGVNDNDQATLLDQSSTLQRRLQEAGYSTGIFGKFLNAWSLAQNPPYFDRWAIFNNAPYTNFKANDQGLIKTIPQYATTYVAQKAMQFIRTAENDDQRPWFLYLAPTAPHAPYTPEPKYVDAAVPEFLPNPAFFEADRSDKPPYMQPESVDPDVVLEHRVAQLRMLMSVDDLVSKVFSTLTSRGETRNTLAFFISDNGWMWGEHGREGKFRPYTHSVKAPLYMRWPDGLTAALDDTRVVANIDLAPTVMEAARTNPDTAIDGRSLLQGQGRERILLERLSKSASPNVAPLWASIRTPAYQYTEYYGGDEYVPGALPEFREYYDLLADPWQLTNYLGDQDPSNDPSPETLEALRLALLTDLNCAGHGEVEGRPACP